MLYAFNENNDFARTLWEILRMDQYYGLIHSHSIFRGIFPNLNNETCQTTITMQKI